MLAGDLDRAERHLKAGRRLLAQMGERAVLASTDGYLAQVALMAGRDREADRHARRCAALATDDDAWAQVVWRQVRVACSPGGVRSVGRSSWPARPSRLR